MSYPTSLEEREQRVRDIPPLVALAPRGLERAIRLQVERNGGFAAAAGAASTAETAIATAASAEAASPGAASAEAASAAAAAYESRFHGHFLNGHFMDYSQFGAARYGSSTGYSNHGCDSQQPTDSSYSCGITSSNNFNEPTNPYIKREDHLGMFPTFHRVICRCSGNESNNNFQIFDPLQLALLHRITENQTLAS